MNNTLEMDFQGWILTENGSPVKAPDERISEWRREMAKTGKWSLRQMVNNVEVSTCFCPFNDEGTWFETMVFASEQHGGDEVHKVRCGTWLEALDQHAEVVTLFGGTT
jgi:hypothetical protein